ncbi:MAG: sulfite exporter TauE/SafE family protein [Myxococcales bacterium]|nr:sulfite exporter TauE/SafE family protein [Myxococcales bacterium]
MLGITLALSLFIGVLLGLLGGGGSILLVPVLLYVLKLEPKSALATSQLVMVTTSLVAMAVHARRGRVVFSTGGLFGLSAMAGAYLGGRVAAHVPARLLMLGFVSLMLLSALKMLRSRNKPETTPKVTPGLPLRAMAAGLPTGFIAGMLGAGGGFLIVPALVLFAGLPIEQAVGTSLLVIAMQSLAGAAGYLGHATVDLRLVAELSASMATSSILGGFLASRVSAGKLRTLFAGLLLAVACFMLIRSVMQ